MNKIIKKGFIFGMSTVMMFSALSGLSWANEENNEILKYNQKIVNTAIDNSDYSSEDKDQLKKDYKITNNYLKLNLIPSKEGTTGPNETFQILHEAGYVGFLVPEAFNNTDQWAEITDGTSYEAGSLGVTGNELERMKESGLDDTFDLNGVTFGELSYPLSNMSINNESKVYESSSSELSNKPINVNSDLSSLKKFVTFTYDGDSLDVPVNFTTNVYLKIVLPEGVSFKNDKDLKEYIKLNGENNKYEIVSAKVGDSKKDALINLKSIEKNKTENEYSKLPVEQLNIDFDISALKYDENNARLGENYTIQGNLFGMADNFDRDASGKSAKRVASFFATKQDPSKKSSDYTLDTIMSVTVAIKYNTVKFDVDGKEYASVKAETGKSIDNDIDKTQSMPKNPTKDGYTFKGWNTQKDGKGQKFDGNTVVDKDITVYAIWEKKDTTSKPGGSGGSGGSGGHDKDNTTTGRIDGKDRIDTSINISKKYYNKADTVIVVRHDLFPDSMTASVLAKLKEAPILLNPTDKLDSRVGNEIKRLGAKEIIIVGGEDSISAKVREELKAYDSDKNVERIAGVDRYGTSEMVARRVVGITGKKNVGVVASGQVFPDALSVGTYASREGYPILLVEKNKVPVQISKAVKDLDIKKTYIAGGLNTISKETADKLPDMVERMAGADRYETSLAIAKSKFKNSKDVFVASGEVFADALVISPISGKYNRPTLLVVNKVGNNKKVKDYIYNFGIKSITAVGGEKYLSYNVLEDLVR